MSFWSSNKASSEVNWTPEQEQMYNLYTDEFDQYLNKYLDIVYGTNTTYQTAQLQPRIYGKLLNRALQKILIKHPQEYQKLVNDHQIEVNQLRQFGSPRDHIKVRWKTGDFG